MLTMPWYSPWSDHIAKSVCKYLLQRYLGQFLEEKLTLDQLTVDLYKGIGVISDVALDVQALNEVAEQQNVPFQFLDGFIEKMLVSIPWSSILTDATVIEVEGLCLTVKNAERDKTRVSMIESMWSSMTSSMQLAEDCLKKERDSSENGGNAAFEGIESFAHTIDSILSRIRVKFLRTVIRLEETPENQLSGMALEFHIKLMEYFDEAAAEESECGQQEFQLSAFSTKKIYLEGVTLRSDEFVVPHAAENKSNADNENDKEEMQSQLESDCLSRDVIIGRFAGRQEITMNFKKDGIEEPKVDLQISLGALTIFLSPHQAHCALDLLSRMTSPTQSSNSGEQTENRCHQKQMEDSDFSKIEQELQMNMYEGTEFQKSKGLTNRGWANTCSDTDDEEFIPLQNSCRLNDSVTSSMCASSIQNSCMSESSASLSSQTRNSPLGQRKKAQSGNADLEAGAIVFQFHILLSSLSIVLLHDDILTFTNDSQNIKIANSSFEEMRNLSNKFFESLGHFVASGYGNKDFEKARDVFSNICQLNHIRLMAAPIIIEGSEICTVQRSLIQGKCTASRMEILECLFEKDPSSQKKIIEHVEILKFKNLTADKKSTGQSLLSHPNLSVNFKLSQTNSDCRKGRRYIRPKSEFSFELQPFETEVDITVADRISALLNWKQRFTPKTSGQPLENVNFFADGHVSQNRSIYTSKQNIKATSSLATFKIRFPIPDLRPIHDLDKTPWWKRSVRKDILYLDVTDLAVRTVLDSSEPIIKYEMEFRDLTAKFQECDTETPVQFAKASAMPDQASPEDFDNFDLPRIVLRIYPKTGSRCLDDLSMPINHYKSSGHNLGQSLVSSLESTARKEHSPFSCKKVIHESDTPHCKGPCAEPDGEELVIPGDRSEISDFAQVASQNTRIKLDVSLPAASVVLPSKHMYEVIYNRISNDLLLWEPAAPARADFFSDSNLKFEESGDDFVPTFSLCKSVAQGDSDSDTESQDGIFYSVYEQRQRYRKKQSLEGSSVIGQSKVVLETKIGKGFWSLDAPVRDSLGNVIPRQHGHLYISFEEGNIFLTSGYMGNPDLDYFCVQANHFSFYHKGLVSEAFAPNPVFYTAQNPAPSHLELIVEKTDKCALIDQSTSVGSGRSKSQDMLTVSVRVEKRHMSQDLKMFLVAVGIREATLLHKVSNGQSSWFTQLVDFFDVDDYPIAGYDPSSVLSEINVHLWNCSVDYRPLYLPLRSVLTIGNFNISSNIASQNSSTLRFIAEDAAFFISDRGGHRFANLPADLRKDYVCVIELGLFELSLRLTEKSQTNPKIDLRASANVAQVWTCSDSAKALAELLMYFASDGDLNLKETNESEQSCPPANAETYEQTLVKTEESENVHTLSKSQLTLVNDLMEEAMKESEIGESNNKNPFGKIGKTIYYQTDAKEGNFGESEEPSLGSEIMNVNDFEFDEKEESWEEEFCIVQNEAGMGMMPKKGLPEVRNLTKTPVRLVDNHFSVPLGKADLLRSPKHYPKPVLRYMLREMSLVWHMYGGHDFDAGIRTPVKNLNVNHKSGNNTGNGQEGASEPVVAFSKRSSEEVRFKSKTDNSMNWKRKGGPQRRHDILMELQLNKVRFQHEVYPDNTVEASRQVLLIQDVELRDRLATSTINKFLYQYSSEAKPKQSQAPMVVVKSVLLRSDPKVNAQECCLKVSLLPLRLNVDQDSVLFLYQFFSELSDDGRDDEDECSPRTQTPKHQQPVMTVNVEGHSKSEQPEPQHLLIDLHEENQYKVASEKKLKRKNKRLIANNKHSSQPIFIRCFIFSPEVPVKLDYQGKRVDMSHGSLAGILMGLGQLNNSELRLRKISHRHGLLGFDKLMNFVLLEWANDIKKNQLPSLLGGVGPMHSLVQLVQGIRDLLWLPIEQYQKDGRLMRGFQRGANSFTTSTAMASLELLSRLIQIIQTTAETAYDMVSPGPSVRTARGLKNKGKTKHYSQPADIREGMAIAYLVVKEGIGETAETLVRVASEEHEQKGMTGAVGGVLRQIPPTMVKPIILATEATNNVIGGVRSQLVPDARKEAVEKWRKQDL